MKAIGGLPAIEYRQKRRGLADGKIATRLVLDRRVVPHDDVVGLPRVRVLRRACLRVVLQRLQQRPPFVVRHTVDVRFAWSRSKYNADGA